MFSPQFLQSGQYVSEYTVLPSWESHFSEDMHQLYVKRSTFAVYIIQPHGSIDMPAVYYTSKIIFIYNIKFKMNY
jgi:hypothetical protein